MGNAWIEALKEYNKGHNKWCVVKKGTPEYNEVKKIMERKSAPKSKESEPAGKPRQLGPYEWQIYYGQTTAQKRLSDEKQKAHIEKLIRKGHIYDDNGTPLKDKVKKLKDKLKKYDK